MSFCRQVFPVFLLIGLAGLADRADGLGSDTPLPAADGTHGSDALPAAARSVQISDDLALSFIEDGEGSPVLLIPGWPQSKYAWRFVIPKLAREYRVIAVDPRGFGGSDMPAEGYDMARVADDMQAVMQRLGHDRYVVIGHDIGMWIGYQLAARHPESVRALAVFEAAIPGLGPSPPLFLSPDANERLWHFPFNQLEALPEMLIKGRERPYLAWLFQHKAYQADVLMGQTLDHYAGLLAEPGRLSAGLAYYRAIPVTAAQNREAAKTRLTMPVLALGGTQGAGELPYVTMQRVAERVTGGVIPLCGHYMPEECPEMLTRHIRLFLRGLPAVTAMGSADLETKGED